MKSLLVILVCLVLCVDSALYFMVQDEYPGHENQCYDELSKSFYNAGERMSSEPGMCSRVTCRGRWKKDSQRVVVERATCGIISAMPGCQIVEDLTKPYPECCPRIVECNELLNKYSE